MARFVYANAERRRRRATCQQRDQLVFRDNQDRRGVCRLLMGPASPVADAYQKPIKFLRLGRLYCLGVCGLV